MRVRILLLEFISFALTILTGVWGFETNPVIVWENGQGVVADQLHAAGMKCKQATGQPPDLIVCILPEDNTSIHNAIKQYVRSR